MTHNNFNINGLTANEVLQARKKYGSNTLVYKKSNKFFAAILNFAKDPMIILLFIAATIYFVNGSVSDGIFLSSAIVFVILISSYQNARSHNALEKLKTFTQQKAKVIRDGKTQEIKSEDLVMGDSLMVDEGALIAADAVIIHSNDFSVNESILTGESLTVYKDKTSTNKLIFKGTNVASGLAIATISAIGNQTRLGKIGESLDSIKEEKTFLEIQIANFVKKMLLAGVVIFFTVWGVNYFNSFSFLDSLLKALTLAMSIMPEEIPVAFTSFMALGAWRLMKKGIVVKQMKTVETLGSASVICTDKTGTITENTMSLAKLFVLKTDKIWDDETHFGDYEKSLIKLAMFASEPIPFDPMEKALHQSYLNNFSIDERPNYKLVHEYPLSGHPPMMTHVFENKTGERIIAAKGAPEALIKIANLNTTNTKQINNAINILTKDGYRILGLAEASFKGENFPKKQQDFEFEFMGIVAFYDPPKKNISAVLQKFYSAGIAVKIITGDNAETTSAIAKQIGFNGYNKTITGEQLMKLTEPDLKKTVMETNIFTRMFPDAKLKIINALKANQQIVAMVGDGVNDGPALKAAHIGIAMGKKGTQIAKEAASLILVNDNLSKMIEAIASGRKIYANLKKAIQYIISIHIPIILIVFIPLVLGWIYPNLFSPVHIIFLELIMGPTCSIVFENEPIEKNAMLQKPRSYTHTFFNKKELITSILQGLAITVGTLLAYQYALHHGYNITTTRTMVFTVLVTANVFLTLVNRSFYYSILYTLRYKNKLMPIILSITIVILGLMLYLKPVTLFFNFIHLNITQLLISLAIGFLSVIWFEAVKFVKRIQNKTI